MQFRIVHTVHININSIQNNVHLPVSRIFIFSFRQTGDRSSIIYFVKPKGQLWKNNLSVEERQRK